jgi:hypothetical protein
MSSLKSKFMMVIAIISITAMPTVAMAAIAKTDIQGLYVAYFGRPADPTGLAYWLDVAAAASAAGQSDEAILSSMSNSFASNPEFAATYAGLSSSAIIDKVYHNLFGHAPDPGGLLYWSAKLSSGALTLGQIVTAISDAAVAAKNSDGDAFTSKVAAATAFTDHVDTTAEILGYTGVAAGDLAKKFLAGVTDVATLATAIAGLDATIATVTNSDTAAAKAAADAAAQAAAEAAAKAIADAAAQAAADAVAKAAADAAATAVYQP